MSKYRLRTGTLDWVDGYVRPVARMAIAVGTIEAWNSLSDENKLKFDGGRFDVYPHWASHTNHHWHQISDIDMAARDIGSMDLSNGCLIDGHHFRITDSSFRTTQQYLFRWCRNGSIIRNIHLHGVRMYSIVSELTQGSTLEDSVVVDCYNIDSLLCAKTGTNGTVRRCSIIGGGAIPAQHIICPIKGTSLTTTTGTYPFSGILHDISVVGYIGEIGGLYAGGSVGAWGRTLDRFSNIFSTANVKKEPYPTNLVTRISNPGTSTPVVDNCYFTLGDPDLYRQNNTMEGGGTYIANNADMYQQSTYVGWDFETVWYPPEDGQYPLLRALWEEIPPIPTYPLVGHSTNIELAIDIQAGHDNSAYYYDYGNTLDEYTCNGQWYTEGREFRERERHEAVNIAGRAYGPHVVGDVPSYQYPTYRGGMDTGKYHLWMVRTIPKNDGVWEYVSPVFPQPMPFTGFRFGALNNCPIPQCEPTDTYRQVYNRIGNVVREYDRGRNVEKRIVKFRWVNVKNIVAGAIISYIITQVRSMPVEVDFGNVDRMGAFRIIGDSGTVYNVRLWSPDVEINHGEGDLWSISIEVIIWQ